jgi:hypothetical protein
MQAGTPAHDGIEEPRALFRGADLDLPPVSRELARHFKRRDERCFSSRAIKRSPYLIDDYIVECSTGRPNDYVLLAHAGHGVNSYALHCYLVQAPLELFLQVAWGGAYTDMTKATADANECFRLAGEFLDAGRGALRRGRLSAQDRLMAVASSFYGGCCTLPGHTEPRADHRLRSIAWLKGIPQDFLRQAIEWCNASTRSDDVSELP